MRSAPTTDSAAWCLTPAAASAASRFRVDRSKNSITAASSQDGEFVTSTTAWAPASASASPSPVRALTPEEGEAETASWPPWRSRGISFLPMSPLPPITTIFMSRLLVRRPQRGPSFDLRHRPAGQLVRVQGHVHGPDPALDVHLSLREYAAPTHGPRRRSGPRASAGGPRSHYYFFAFSGMTTSFTSAGCSTTA